MSNRTVSVLLILVAIMAATMLGLDVQALLTQTEAAVEVVEQLDDLAAEPAPEPEAVEESETEPAPEP